VSLRLKALLVIIGATALILGIVFAVSQYFFMNSFQRIEEQYARDMVQRTINAFENRLRSLNTLNLDYAAWDDTYTFVQNPDDNGYYIKSNLTDTTFINNKLNYIFIINREGHEVYGSGFDLTTNTKIDISPVLREHMLSSVITHHESTESSVTGIVLLPQGPLLVSAEPILTSDNKGPIMGTFVMAQYFGPAAVTGLSDTVHLPLTVVRVDDINAPGEFRAASLSLSPESPVYIARESEKTIAGYAMLDDIYGAPALIARVEMPRDVSAQGRAMMVYFILVVCGLAIIYVYILNVFVGRVIITRLERVGKFVSKISLSGDLSANLPTRANDELTVLERNINRMVDKLQEQQEELNNELEERKKMAQKLKEMATHDFLTGLPNRILLVDRYNIAAALAHRNQDRLAVMSLDIDRFKSINDTLGHDTGDKVLKAFGDQLTGIIRASDTLARVGGDEFILLMLETNHMEDATAIARKILESFKEPLYIDDHWIYLSTSIGVAIYPEDATDLEALVKKSDAALYYAKGHGRNNYKFFRDGDVWISGDRKSKIN
jgi:diguanylate cyclase (GGDEF)-like protein